MPKGEIERHPYLTDGEIPNSTRLILGSFPVYECTDDDSELKRNNRLREGTIRFFYGSNRNSLWTEYQKYVDNTLQRPWSKDNILISLTNNSIAVSDIVTSCERYIYKTNKRTGEEILDPYSSEDSALHKKKWNKDGVRRMIGNGVSKILCTSKGVLGNLSSKIICPAKKPVGRVDQEQSINLQTTFIEQLNGDQDSITGPTALAFTIGTRTILAVALPSPGSPQRQLKEFGLNGQNWRTYADNYFEKAFEWLSTD